MPGVGSHEHPFITMSSHTRRDQWSTWINGLETPILSHWTEREKKESGSELSLQKEIVYSM